MENLHTNAIENNTETFAIGPDGQVSLKSFFDVFGKALANQLDASFPPLYSGAANERRQKLCEQLLKKPFPAQMRAIHTCAAGLVDHNLRSVILNGTMGTGKTLMAIASALILAKEKGYRRFLVLSPPHLIYKWRREILESAGEKIDGLRVEVVLLNGSDTIRQLNARRNVPPAPDTIEFYILGRVRMRMGIWWNPAVGKRKNLGSTWAAITASDGRCKPYTSLESGEYYWSCSRCGAPVLDNVLGLAKKTGLEPAPLGVFIRANANGEAKLCIPVVSRRIACTSCGEPLWTSTRRLAESKLSEMERLEKALVKLPSVGRATARKLIDICGVSRLTEMLEDRIHDLKNLPHPDDTTNFFFPDRTAKRLDRAFARSNGEFFLSEGTSYQPSHFIRQYMRHFFDLAIVDEGHEYKELSSAQGQAMGTIVSQAKQCMVLTGTLMGGYADNLFYLLWRAAPSLFVRDGLKEKGKALASAGGEFMKRFGVIEHTYDVLYDQGRDFATAKARQTPVIARKKPGFSAAGIAQYVLPQTVFVKLEEISDKLPPYKEHLSLIEMSDRQRDVYLTAANAITKHLRNRLLAQDRSFLGKAFSVLLAQADTAWMSEAVRHRGNTIASIPQVFAADEYAPKEKALLDLILKERKQNRKVLVYCNLTQTRDLTRRLQALLSAQDIKVAVLRSSVKTDEREEWLDTQAERGIEVLITNPELVKTGLDLIEYPTICFMQTGYSVYTLMQAARRSWRIGQDQAVNVHFFGYAETLQQSCLTLMSQKISVAQSVQGDLPENGLSMLNTRNEEDSAQSIQEQLAKEIFARFTGRTKVSRLKKKEAVA